MSHIMRMVRRFRDDDRGSIAVETILIIPILFWVYLTMFAIFDAYRQHSITQKAAYTLGDIISRETNPVDSSYLNGSRELLAYLTTNSKSNVAIRVTSVKYDANEDIYKRDWSKTKGWVSALDNKAVKDLADNLPVMPHNERVMVVETFVKYDAPFNTGLTDHEIHNFVFTRPRYAPRVLWSDN
jgi:hypothetical protein